MNIDVKLDSLKKDGHRITRVRQKLLEIFAAVEKPLAARELIELLGQSRIKVNKTTVYREIEFLMEQKLLHEIDFNDGVKRYENADNDHHHHLVCDNCGNIEDIPLDENLLINQVMQRTKFKIERHSLEFFGYCTYCQ